MMKGMCWVWVGALLVGMGIVGIMNLASEKEAEPVTPLAAETSVSTVPAE